MTMDDLYDNLETTKGQKKIYRIAKARNRKAKDITHTSQMKDENREVPADEGKIRERW